MSTVKAATLLREFLESVIVDRIASVLGVPDARMRVTLAVSYIAGRQARYVLRMEPLASASVDELVRLVAPAGRTALAGAGGWGDAWSRAWLSRRESMREGNPRTANRVRVSGRGFAPSGQSECDTASFEASGRILRCACSDHDPDGRSTHREPTGTWVSDRYVPKRERLILPHPHGLSRPTRGTPARRVRFGSATRW